MNGGPINRVTDIGYHQFGVAFGLERQSVDFLRGGKLAVGVDVVVFRPDAHIAGRQNRIGIVDGAHHIHQAQLMRLQLYGIDIDLNLPVLAAEGLRYRRSGHIRNLIPNRELSKIVQFRLIQTLALQRDQADRQTGRVELKHDWR